MLDSRDDCAMLYVMKRNKTPIINVKKYGGRQVAIVDGKIIAAGRTLSHVIALARKRVPQRPLHDIHIFAVPKTLSVIYHV